MREGSNGNLPNIPASQHLVLTPNPQHLYPCVSPEWSNSRGKRIRTPILSSDIGGLPDGSVNDLMIFHEAEPDWQSARRSLC